MGGRVLMGVVVVLSLVVELGGAFSLDGVVPGLRLLRRLSIISDSRRWQVVPLVDGTVDVPVGREAAPGAEEEIPRILHQTWIDEDVPERWHAAVNSCKELNPNYTYMFWTHKTMKEFVHREFPEMVETFDGYPHDIQRADAFRYMMLVKHGGFYADLDVGCEIPLDKLRGYQPFLLGGTQPWGFSNCFIATAPRSPFFRRVVERLPETRWNGWPFRYTHVLLSTGSMFLSLEWATWMLWPPVSPEVSQKYKGWFLPQKALFGNKIFHHYKGGSWQGSSDFVVYHLHELLLAGWGTAIASTFGAVLVLFVMMRTRQKLRERRMGAKVIHSD